MSTSKQRAGGKERFWRRVLRQWRQSGLSVREYCWEAGLSEPSFYSWRRTLAQRDASPVQFVPLAVASEPPSPQANPTDPGAAGGLELVLDNGRVLRVRPGFDAPTLQRLLGLLEGGQA